MLAAFAVLVGASGVAAALRSTPEAALNFNPYDARALAEYASELLLGGQGKVTDRGQALIYAREALARDATLPVAWRTLALISSERPYESVRLLRIAETLSRRDVPTQLALLEHQVQKGDILGALRHYEIILNVSTAYDQVLFPVLAAASKEAPIRGALSRQLLRATLWRRRFLSYIVNSSTPLETQADLFAAMANAGRLPDRDIVAAQATSSALAGQFPVAERFYRLVAPAEASRSLRNGGFEEDGGVAPFDWSFDTSDSLDVAVEPTSSGRRLEITSPHGDGARAARQLLSLPAGRYRLTARSGELRGQVGGSARMTLACAQGSRLLGSFESSRQPDRFGGEVTVPASCQTQWLELSLVQNPNGEADAIWIDDVAIVSAVTSGR